MEIFNFKSCWRVGKVTQPLWHDQRGPRKERSVVGLVGLRSEMMSDE